MFITKIINKIKENRLRKRKLRQVKEIPKFTLLDIKAGR